jgi:hypothetical protein
LILHNKQRLESTPHGSQRGKAETNRSRLGKKECYMNLNIEQKSKAARGNLMNLLDLAKSNRANN